MKTRESLPRDRKNDYSKSIIDERVKFLGEETNTTISLINNFSVNPESTKGNIENIIGFAQVPIGIIGPLKVNGEHANGEFYVPLSTLEGTLIASHNRGAKLITLSGGANVKVYNNAIQRAPVFIFKSIVETFQFLDWVKNNFDTLKDIAESTSKNLKMIGHKPYPAGSAVYLRLEFTTNDAMGMNMITKASRAVCEYLLERFEVEDFFLEGNVAVDKKSSAMNFINGRGKSVTADVLISRKNTQRLLGATPERIKRLSDLGIIGSSIGGTHGANYHYANGLAAIFLACGQDMANVTESAVGMSYIDVRDGDLYFSVTLPSLVVGTVGGGTGLGTQKECLSMLGCSGKGTVMKFAEIVAAVVLAGEISLCGAICADDWVDAHEKYGKNRPVVEERK